MKDGLKSFMGFGTCRGCYTLINKGDICEECKNNMYLWAEIKDYYERNPHETIVKKRKVKRDRNHFMKIIEWLDNDHRSV